MYMEILGRHREKKMVRKTKGGLFGTILKEEKMKTEEEFGQEKGVSIRHS